jgi:hypothetical protein
MILRIKIAIFIVSMGGFLFLGCSDSDFASGAGKLAGKDKSDSNGDDDDDDDDDDDNGSDGGEGSNGDLGDGGNQGGNGPPVITSEPVNPHKAGDPIGNPEDFDLTKWEVIQYELNDQPDANWNITPQTATQTVNADASILLSDLDVVGNKIQGTWKAIGSSDDDYMGFVFGYQDRSHYYIFDWKKATQTSSGLTAQVGMNVKVLSKNGDPTLQDLWPSAGNGTTVKGLFHNSIGWKFGVEYEFILDFAPGLIRIEVKEGATRLALIEVDDDTYKDGKFGMYNYSQDTISYEGFKKTPILGSTYIYDVEATDPDNDKLVYSLEKAPPGMTIDADSGKIRWPKADISTGEFEVTVVVSDPQGLTDVQTYTLEVKEP